MQKKYYDIYKKLGRCTQCGKEAQAPGRVSCYNCLEKSSKQKRTYNKERKSYYRKRKRELCEAFGICRTCMSKDVYIGSRCIYCYLKAKAKYRDKILSEGKIPKDSWSALGLCSICGKDKAVEGKNVCEKHIKIYKDLAQNARTYINRDNHKWRKDKELDFKIKKSKEII